MHYIVIQRNKESCRRQKNLVKLSRCNKGLIAKQRPTSKESLHHSHLQQLVQEVEQILQRQQVNNENQVQRARGQWSK